ncbi:GNAT family N-acetyltransferase [Rossellomorea aquimaris]|uniref:GNAT family N-acetyltransferase n=1 Tax=Rossellomorea aquimaris TaxID=189382 RepID=UPI001CD65944|nr:GNAT family protein [Rossellomorea aquimaris]MCA1054115.1 GNAT family N-acetyltransferase [Rossellomorea aquimaris]
MNHQNCLIRTVKPGDAEALLAISTSIISEGAYFIRVPEESEEMSPDQQREHIQKVLKNDRETMIVAEIDGEVVGSVDFRSHHLKRLAHTGSISMSVSENYRNMGIGKNLLKALLDWAEQHPHIEKVSLGVFSTNQRAISLYKRLGFIEEGRKIKEFKLDDNHYADDILMYKFVQ